MNATYLVATGFEDITVSDDDDQIIEDIAHLDWDCISCLESWCVFQRIFCVALSTYRSCDVLIPRPRNPAVGA